MTERRNPDKWMMLRTTKEGHEPYDRLVTSYKARHDGTVSWRVSDRVESVRAEGSWFIVSTVADEEYICLPQNQGVGHTALTYVSNLAKESKAIYGGDTELIVLSNSNCNTEKDDDA